ncbi:MAG: GGDEF domain-containing protein [Cognaticolwellia sp.]
MSENIVAEKSINQLKSQLDLAINARRTLEEEFSAQSSLLIGFIGKLSQACKGTDILLDNKLAKLRTTLKKSTSFAELENEIQSISILLQQYSLKSGKSIQKVHQQLQASARRLQAVDSMPEDNFNKLKLLVEKIQHSPDSLVQYVPLMSEFIAFYESALPSLGSEMSLGKIDSQAVVTTNKINKITPQNTTTSTITSDQHASKALLQRFNAILNNLVISKKYEASINKIKSCLKGNISNHLLMTKCLNVFDLIIEDLKQERSSAKIFLSTLSETLASVQASVSSTIASTAASNDKNDKINQELVDKLAEISVGINGAGSLVDMKVDVNEKLQQIALTLQKKTSFEEKQRVLLREKLDNMSAQVEQLELQSKSFEKRIQEEQEKSRQDALTKLGNRAAFDEFFSKEIVRYHHKQFDLALTVLDLDDFKRINDTYGHTAGDKTLQVIANTLTKVVGNDAFIARYGGEEFVLIFTDSNKNVVLNKLDILRKKVASLPFTFKNNRVSITLSIGVTMIENGDNVHSAFERADAALYQAKKDGKNRVIYG